MVDSVISALPAAGADPPPQATLIYNAVAGGAGQASPDHLVEKLHQIGYFPVYRATDSEDDLQAALHNVQGHVFVAGGDGTVRATALYLAGRPGVVLGVIPMGTANNIGRTLGIRGEPLEVVASYRDAVARSFDLGRVAAPWGNDLFLEACGCGAFADIITEYHPDEGKSPLRAAQALAKVLGDFDPPPLEVTLEGQPWPAQPYALLEVLNTRATGPRLQLATHADPSDGLLDMIAVGTPQRQTLLAYLTALARDEFADLPSVQECQARRVQIPYVGQAFHIDGEVRPPLPGVGGAVSIEVWPAALQVLTPAAQVQP